MQLGSSSLAFRLIKSGLNQYFWNTPSVKRVRVDVYRGVHLVPDTGLRKYAESGILSVLRPQADTRDLRKASVLKWSCLGA